MMKVIWEQMDQHAWDAVHEQQAAPLQQDWAYGSCMKALGVGVLRSVVDQDGTPVAYAQWIYRKIAGLATIGLCSRGPMWVQPLTAQEKNQVYALLRQSLPVNKPRWALFTPEETDTTQLGLSAWRRVMTGYATVMIDLTQSTDDLRAALDSKWRNRLAAAESSELKVQRMGVLTAQYRWLLEMEIAQRTARGFQGLPIPFIDAYILARKQANQTVLNLRADVGRDRVAAMMFLIHGQAATYQVGWSNDQGRDLNAHNLLLWHAILALKERGVRFFDLGGINTQRSAGIARFKIGTGGQVSILAGTYL
ncbi:MAG: peptidoglycan bridge formation glycyltransferase FemA/FemB family protein [Betaproteobacteria bacterium]